MSPSDRFERDLVSGLAALELAVQARFFPTDSKETFERDKEPAGICVTHRTNS